MYGAFLLPFSRRYGKMLSECKAMIKTRWIVFVWRFAAFVVMLCGLLSKLGVFVGKFDAHPLLYYTSQSNILVLVLFGFLTVKTAVDMPYGGKAGNVTYIPRIHAAVTLAITLTFVVYWAALAPFETRALWTFPNIVIHGITPLACIADYMVIQQEGSLKKFDPLLFAVIPAAYFLQATVAGFSGVVYRTAGGVAYRFPYYFIDYDMIGGFVALVVICALAVYVGLGYLMLLLDRKWRKKTVLPRSAMFGI